MIEEDVRIPLGDLTLAGTLSLPAKRGRHPAAILLSGYGPCTRDYEEEGLKKFRVIAAHLVHKGIATLRYDDRGVGGSTAEDWSQATFEDLAQEALAVVEFLQHRADINPQQVGLLGHSLGAAIAPSAASQSENIAFVIAIGGHGLKGQETGRITRQYLGQSLGESEGALVEGDKLLQRLYQAILTEEGWDEIQEKIIDNARTTFENLPNERRESFSGFEGYLNATYEGWVLSNGRTPMYRYFLKHDPLSSWKQVACPVLLLFADLDIIHPPGHHVERILDTLKENNNSDVTIKRFSQTHHGFVTEDPKSRKIFVPGFLETIGEWILKRTDLGE